MSRIYNALATPGRTVLTVIALVSLGYGIAICLPFTSNIENGSLAQLSTVDALALKGHEVYYQEGCQYCHSQNLKPYGWEVSRYAASDKYGFYPLPTAMEYQYETPAMRGSARLGPDLSRVAGKLDANAIAAALKGGPESTLRNRTHAYGYLFADDDMDPLWLSWKVRMMLQTRVPFSDQFHRSVFDRTEGKTRGEALVAYLLSLGEKRMNFDGAYYR